MTSTVADTTAAPATSRAVRILRRHGWTIGVFLLLIALVFYWRGQTTLKWGPFDVQSLAIDALPLCFAACGQAIVILSGGIDLSIGSMMSLVNVVSARVMLHMSFRDAILMSIVIMLGGLALWVLQVPGGGAPLHYQNLVTLDTVVTHWLPSALVILFGAYALLWLTVRRTRVGLALYAIGSNRNAAYLAGVDVSATRVLAYAYSGAFGALGGLALTAASGLGDPNAGGIYTLNSVAAVVLGGVSLLGGVGGLIGPILAAFVLTLVKTIMILKGVDQNYAQVIQGALIVLVVMIGGLVVRQKGKGG